MRIARNNEKVIEAFGPDDFFVGQDGLYDSPLNLVITSWINVN